MEKEFSENKCEMDDESSFEEDESISTLTKPVKLLKPIYENKEYTVLFENDFIKDTFPKERIVEIDFKIKKFNKFCLKVKSYKKWPLCMIPSVSSAGLLKTSSYIKANLVWKLIPYEEILKLVPKLKKYQRYNHFPTTWQLGRKDNLYTNYKKMKKTFPNDFNYMPESFILPRDYNFFINIYKQNPKIMYIIKPVSSSRGRGVKLMTGLDSLPNSCLISKYIDNPYLIANKKFDLRVYVLIRSFSPLKIYLFKEGLVRFASEEYNTDKKNKSNIFIHLTNYSVNKLSKNFDNNVSNDDNCVGSKWTFTALKNYFMQHKVDYDIINNKIKDVIIKTVISVSEKGIHLTKMLTKHKNVLFELHGFDIMLDNNMNPHLIEVNVNPSLGCDTELDTRIKTILITDIFNLIGIIPFKIKATKDRKEEECLALTRDLITKFQSQKESYVSLSKSTHSNIFDEDKYCSEIVLPKIESKRPVFPKRNKSQIKGISKLKINTPNNILVPKNSNVNSTLKITQFKETSNKQKNEGSTTIKDKVSILKSGTRIKICKEFDPLKPNFKFDSSDYLMDDYINMLLESEEEMSRIGNFERIFPLESNIQTYCKFIQDPGDDNIVLWKWIMSKKPIHKFNIKQINAVK